MQTFPHIIASLKKLNFSQLPGIDAQLRMAPVHRQDEIRKMAMAGEPLKSSVLFLIYPLNDGEAGTVLIQRPKYDGVHGGQISFPGGGFEQGDETLMYTALREAHEEVNVDPESVEVLGKLTDLYIPPSNHLVSPYVALAEKRPSFKPDPKEVETIIELPLSLFFNQEVLQTTPISLSDGRTLMCPCYLTNGHVVWGATAMMISEFVELGRQTFAVNSGV